MCWPALLLAGTALHAQPDAAAEAAVREAAREALLQQADAAALLAPQADASVRALAEQRGAVACSGKPEVEAIDLRSAQRMRFAVRCAGSNAPARVYVAQGRLSAEVVVSAVPLSAGQVLGSGDLVLARHDVAGLPDALSDIDAVAGQAALRALRAGQVMQKRLLVRPLLVQRGSVVQIEARRSGVQVSAAGEALEAGRAGDVVRVRNVTTGKIVRARVLGAGVVEPAELPP